MRRCESPTCENVIPPQQGPHRPRKYCETCRPPRNRRNPRLIDLSTRQDREPSTDGDGGPVAGAEDGLVALYRRKLEAADCLDTPEGAHVLHLAMLFVTGQHTAAGAASLSRELDARYSALIAKAPRAGDALDELQERRRRKVSSA